MLKWRADPRYASIYSGAFQSAFVTIHFLLV